MDYIKITDLVKTKLDIESDLDNYNYYFYKDRIRYIKEEDIRFILTKRFRELVDKMKSNQKEIKKVV